MRSVSATRNLLGNQPKKLHSVAVTVKGRGPDPATATTKAAVKLTQRAASLRGKVKKSSTSCQKGPPGGFVCTTSAVVCP